MANIALAGEGCASVATSAHFVSHGEAHLEDGAALLLFGQGARQAVVLQPQPHVVPLQSAHLHSRRVLKFEVL